MDHNDWRRLLNRLDRIAISLEKIASKSNKEIE